MDFLNNERIFKIIKSFAKKFDNHLSLLSYDRWTGKREMEFAYYNDLYIQNPSNISDEFIITTPARAPLNYFGNGYMISCEMII